MKVKICGITDSETAIEAVRCGADAIGMVFAESTRKVSMEQAKEITQSLPPHILKIGVFVNEAMETMEKIASYAGLTHIQLHGDEPAQVVSFLSLPVIKAFRVQDPAGLNGILDYPAEFLLLDGPKGKYWGGNGASFDWSAFQPEDFKGRKIILAGGLTSENVEAAIQAIRPYMVDVSSGVETEGKKDKEKLQLFIEKSRNV